MGYFAALTIAFLLLILIVIRYKEYEKSLAIYLFMASTIFYFTPSYYIFGGRTYRYFKDQHLEAFILFSIVILLSFSAILLLKQKLPVFKPLEAIKSNPLITLYMAGIVVVILLYIFYFRDRFPLIMALTQDAEKNPYRPDSTGSIPLYFTVMTFVYYVVPSFYFYIIETRKTSPLMHVVMIGFISCLLLIGGNKGVFLYFLFFIWVYVLKLKLDWRVIVMGVVSAIFYFGLKEGFGYLTRDITKNILGMVRRLFVTQGSGFIDRIYLKDTGLILGKVPLSNVVHAHIYHVSGSNPTYFVGDLVFVYGYIKAFIIHTAVLLGLTVSSKWFDDACSKHLYLKWSFFTILYLLAMAEVTTSTWFKFLAIVCNALVLYFVSKYYEKVFPRKTKNAG